MDKEVEIFEWMKKQGYDRRASKDIAPIIVKYLEQHGATPAVSSSLPHKCINNTNISGDVCSNINVCQRCWRQ